MCEYEPFSGSPSSLSWPLLCGAVQESKVEGERPAWWLSCSALFHQSEWTIQTWCESDVPNPVVQKILIRHRQVSCTPLFPNCVQKEFFFYHIPLNWVLDTGVEFLTCLLMLIALWVLRVCIHFVYVYTNVNTTDKCTCSHRTIKNLFIYYTVIFSIGLSLSMRV